MPGFPTLLDSVSDTLRRAGLPLAGHGHESDGAVVTALAHGVTVSWQGAPDPAAGHQTWPAPVRTRACAAARSSAFRNTLRIAAVLAEAGYHCEHTGERVLIGRSH
ncbi:hypothetical protein ACFW1A_32510 [Kitasatospora sp. NPDC058965]|uniref:hypothetical protein n=1 Tax=Kitasatospora sp. NPDC058965 TaxID=3346682 RepID=UPI0036A969E4